MIFEIFLPEGIVWQIWPDAIRTRRVCSGRVIMKRRRCGGDFGEWLTAARNITCTRDSAWIAGTMNRKAA